MTALALNPITVSNPVGLVVGTWIAIGTILLAEHTKNKRPSNWDKHTNPRPGRPTTKNRQNPNWQNRGGKKKPSGNKK